MPKKIDPALRERAVRLVREHRAEYPSTARAIAVVARQEGVGAESLRIRFYANCSTVPTAVRLNERGRR